MKIITLQQYVQLKDNGCRLIGRVHPGTPNPETICFCIEEDELGFSGSDVLDALSLINLGIMSGEYLVIRHWCSPEGALIQYKTTS